MDLRIENHGNMLKAFVTAEASLAELLLSIVSPDALAEEVLAPGESVDEAVEQFFAGVFSEQLNDALSEMIEFDTAELLYIREKEMRINEDGSVVMEFEMPLREAIVMPGLENFTPSGPEPGAEELKRELFEHYLDNSILEEREDLVKIFSAYMKSRPESIPTDAFLNKIAYTLGEIDLSDIEDYDDLAKRYVRANMIVRDYTHEKGIDEQFHQTELDHEVKEYVKAVGNELYEKNLSPEEALFTLDSFDLCVLYTRMVNDLLELYQGNTNAQI